MRRSTPKKILGNRKRETQGNDKSNVLAKDTDEGVGRGNKRSTKNSTGKNQPKVPKRNTKNEPDQIRQRADVPMRIQQKNVDVGG